MEFAKGRYSKRGKIQIQPDKKENIQDEVSKASFKQVDLSRMIVGEHTTTPPEYILLTDVARRSYEKHRTEDKYYLEEADFADEYANVDKSESDALNSISMSIALTGVDLYGKHSPSRIYEKIPKNIENTHLFRKDGNELCPMGSDQAEFSEISVKQEDVEKTIENINDYKRTISLELIFPPECNLISKTSKFMQSHSLLPQGNKMRKMFTINEVYLGVKNNSLNTIKDVCLCVNSIKMPPVIVDEYLKVDGEQGTKTDIHPGQLKYFYLGVGWEDTDRGMSRPKIMPLKDYNETLDKYENYSTNFQLKTMYSSIIRFR